MTPLARPPAPGAQERFPRRPVLAVEHLVRRLFRGAEAGEGAEAEVGEAALQHDLGAQRLLARAHPAPARAHTDVLAAGARVGARIERLRHAEARALEVEVATRVGLEAEVAVGACDPLRR